MPARQRLIGVAIDQRDPLSRLVPIDGEAGHRRRFAGAAFAGGGDQDFTDRVFHGSTSEKSFHGSKTGCKSTWVGVLPGSASRHRRKTYVEVYAPVVAAQLNDLCGRRSALVLPEG